MNNHLIIVIILLIQLKKNVHGDGISTCQTTINPPFSHNHRTGINLKKTLKLKNKNNIIQSSSNRSDQYYSSENRPGKLPYNLWTIKTKIFYSMPQLKWLEHMQLFPVNNIYTRIRHSISK